MDDGLGCLIVIILGLFALAFIGLNIHDATHCKDSLQLVEKYTQTACSHKAKGTIVSLKGREYLQCECPE